MMIVALALCSIVLKAQILYDNGASITIQNTTVTVKGDVFIGSGSEFDNNGQLNVSGNLTNNAVMTNYPSGLLNFNGTNPQVLNGTQPYLAIQVRMDNAAGLTLNNPLKVGVTIDFVNGDINANNSNAPLIFDQNLLQTNGKDISHVNGYILKMGGGPFLAPVGDGVKYQPLLLNLQSGGNLLVKYNGSDAGTAPFTPNGSDFMPLASYNTKEYWEVTPETDAFAEVEIFWDGYKDAYSNNVVERRVAHKINGEWRNEGTFGSGTPASGSVRSNNITIPAGQNIFTLGTIQNVLPVQWLSITGNLNSSKQAVINFKVNETNVANYSVQKSTDGNSFISVTTVNSKGDGENTYTATDLTPLTGTGYYRVKQTDRDGRFSYSAIVKLAAAEQQFISVYPNPAVNAITISGATPGTRATLVTMDGKLLQSININSNTFTLNMGNYSSGTYILKTSDGQTEKIIKL